MAKTAVPQFDTTAANNTDINNVSIAPGYAAPNIRGGMSNLMVLLKNECARYPSVASAATIDISLYGAYSVTGTTSVTAMTVTSGSRRRLIFSDALTLTHDGDAIILPSGASITSAAGDCLDLVAHDTNKVTVTQYTRASGRALIYDTYTVREKLAANRTYYVRTDGSDSNTGLVNDAAGAWLTLQKAWDTIQDTLDLAGYVVTVQVGDGTYTGPLSAKGKCVGQENQDSIVFQGNSGTPTNVIVNATSPSSGATIFSGGGAAFTIKDMRIRSTTTGDGLVANMGSTIYFSGLDFGACAGAHIAAAQQSFILASGNYTISGAATRHWQAQFSGSLIFVSGRTVTISGTPAFSTAFATSAELSDISCSSMTFTGSATGTRYSVILNAVISTAGGGATYLPGDVGGSSATGGQYA